MRPEVGWSPLALISEERMTLMEKKSRLGRGLDALLSAADSDTSPQAAGQAEVRLDQIHNNPWQPRKVFDEDELASLSESIRNHGILQPLVVRAKDDGYQLIAGERRLRAARAAGLDAVPVRVVNFNDQQVLEAALVENIHRTDLNPIEKAHGFKEYLDRFQMTHEELARRLGLARPTISNLLGLLELPGEVQDYVRTGPITLSHAKILKGVADPARQVSLCKEVVSRGLSAHGLDALLKEQKQAEQEAAEEPTAPRAPAVEKTAHVKGLEDELRQRLAVKVEIKLKDKDRGQIVLGFESNDDFERLLDALRR
jgi:ParB family chromosome partitioning protein